MGWLTVAAGILLNAFIIWDVFEAMVLPRRVTRRFRPTRVFYRVTWGAAKAVALRLPAGARREASFSFYGPLSLLVLFSLWAVCLIAGFTLIHLGAGTRPGASLSDYAYMSGETLFTLGYGDITPVTRFGRALAVAEAGTGFGFLALVIGYLPVLYQAFSRREVAISLLDARAGSPPSAEELLRRHGRDLEALASLLAEWERWCAEVLESHVSYPVLAFYRSQHDNQSWLGALTTILDAAALIIVGVDGACARQAALTFAIARHAVADLSQVFHTPPRPPAPDRLPAEVLERLRAALAVDGVVLKGGAAADARLADLRRMYEPYVNALANHLLLPLPSWATATTNDNWRTTAWRRREADAPQPLLDTPGDDH